ncbi:hypothetical protein I5907_08850 [Panacibacter sp. DH6]|uniref:Uncharacterized protein n=1 Tax=Panacibacter microcysteis TaxID=2793269 RepID=A0A931E6T9_9BACT|nr:hypothetical protein [Panacibacter microcysteis]MBG9376340.1 hypothetical protein [Panacibacter microcysteis]
MQTFLIFICWFIVFAWLLTKIKFVTKTGLGAWWIIALFSIKVIAGIGYAWFYSQPAYFATSDTWHFYALSKGETDWLLNDPVAFLKDIFVYGYERSGNLFLSENSYWNDLKSNLVIKLLAICNVLTLKEYYADIVLFNFIFFFGPVALFRIVQQLFTVNRLLLIAGVFLIPSFLFWYSGVHKDGLIFTTLALVVYYFNEQLLHKKINWQQLLLMVFFFTILFAFRNFMALLLLGGLVVWLLCEILPLKKIWVVSTVIVLAVVAFFVSASISTATDMPQYIIQKQAEFKALSGNSGIDVPVLEHSVAGFLRFLPYALDIAFFRPHVAEIKNISYIPAVAEIYFFWAVVIVSIFVRKKVAYTNKQVSFLVFCMFFSFSFLLLAGYTITFSGAIVRYKACILPFLFVPVILNLSSFAEKIFKGKASQ